jgi:hypothetical protein
MTAKQYGDKLRSQHGWCLGTSVSANCGYATPMHLDLEIFDLHLSTQVNLGRRH